MGRKSAKQSEGKKVVIQDAREENKTDNRGVEIDPRKALFLEMVHRDILGVKEGEIPQAVESYIQREEARKKQKVVDEQNKCTSCITM